MSAKIRQERFVCLPNGTRFATEEALEEIRRVLKPEAVFGMIWNIEDCEPVLNHATHPAAAPSLPCSHNITDNKPKSWKATTSWEEKLNQWIYSISRDGLPRFRDCAWQGVFERQLKSNPFQILKDSLSDKLPRFSLPLGEETLKWTVWLSEEALWARINTLSQVAVLEGEEKEAGIKTFKAALASDDVERNEKGEIALHGVTYMAWTDRI